MNSKLITEYLLREGGQQAHVSRTCALSFSRIWLPVWIHPSLSLWQRGQEWRWTYLRGDGGRDSESFTLTTGSCGLGQIMSLVKPLVSHLEKWGPTQGWNKNSHTTWCGAASSSWCLVIKAATWSKCNVLNQFDTLLPFESFLYCCSDPGLGLLPGVPSLIQRLSPCLTTCISHLSPSSLDSESMNVLMIDKCLNFKTTKCLSNWQKLEKMHYLKNIN